MRTVAGKLSVLRREVTLTQASLAARAGLQRTDIAALESGRLKCRFVSTLRKLASAYGVTLDSLDRYLEGKLSLSELLEARSAGGAGEAP